MKIVTKLGKTRFDNLKKPLFTGFSRAVTSFPVMDLLSSLLLTDIGAQESVAEDGKISTDYLKEHLKDTYSISRS